MITQDQVNGIIRVLGEAPAKLSFDAILCLKNLQPISANETDVKPLDDAEEGPKEEKNEPEQ